MMVHVRQLNRLAMRFERTPLSTQTMNVRAVGSKSRGSFIEFCYKLMFGLTDEYSLSIDHSR